VGAVAQTVHGVAATPVRCPLFQSIIERFDEERRFVVCDLGPARFGTVSLFEPFRCRLEILSLPDLLPALQVCESVSEAEALVRDRVPATVNEPIDALLCWNLLNYLSPELIGAVIGAVAERLAPGGFAHALIEYSSTRMPARPGLIAPNGANQLLIVPDQGESRPSPRYSLAALERCLSGLKSERSMLLGNGMQEYLFRRPATAAGDQ